jgi:hypothetical protein
MYGSVEITRQSFLEVYYIINIERVKVCPASKNDVSGFKKFKDTNIIPS